MSYNASDFAPCGKYDVSNYSVVLFNRRGAKLLKIALGNVGLIAATRWATEKVEAGEAHSFVVERVLVNSMDQREAWQPRKISAEVGYE